MIAALLATIVFAQGGGGAEELWDRYPLDPTPTPAAQQQQATEPTGERDEGQVEVVQQDDGLGTAGLVVLIALAATGGAAALRFAQLAARKRRVAEAGSAPPVVQMAAPAPAESRPRKPAKAAKAAKAVADPSAAKTAKTAKPPKPPKPPKPAAAPSARAAPKPARARRPAPQPPPSRRRPEPEPEPEPVPPPPPPTRRFAPSGEQWETCRIRLWRGYVSRCYVAQVDGAETPIARSSSFRAVATPEATEALQDMVAELTGKGWEQVHDDDGAWHGWMRRPAAARTAG